jgi:hypothetical protein
MILRRFPFVIVFRSVATGVEIIGKRLVNRSGEGVLCRA